MFLAGLLILVVTFAVVVISSSAFAQDKIQIKFRNPFSPTGSWAMFWSCQDRFWPQEGVYGEVEDGKGSADVVMAVGSGSSQMGYCQMAAIMVAVQKGMPIQTILIGTQNDTSALFTLKERGFKNLKDFEGKTVGVFPFGYTGPLVKGMLKKNGVDLTRVKFTNVSVGNELPLLATGKLDAFCGMVSAQDVQLLAMGHDVTVFPIKEYGMPIPSDGIIINTNWAKQVGRETVLKYVRGIARGFILAKTDVNAIIEDMIKYRPDQRLVYDVRMAENYPRWHYKYKSDIIEKHGFGWIDKNVMQFTQETLLDVDILKEKIDVEKYYTMEYITDDTFRPLAMEYAKAKLDPNLKTYYDKIRGTKK
ncbi:MAG: ABC transporter substrate-binding protein [Pseudomonadota bacterium]